MNFFINCIFCKDLIPINSIGYCIHCKCAYSYIDNINFYYTMSYFYNGNVCNWRVYPNNNETILSIYLKPGTFKQKLSHIKYDYVINITPENIKYKTESVLAFL